MKRRTVVTCAAANDDDSEEEEQGERAMKSHKTLAAKDPQDVAVSASKEKKKEKIEKEFAWMDSDDEGGSGDGDKEKSPSAEEDEEVLERSVEGLNKLQTCGRVMLVFESLCAWLKSGELSSEEAVGVCQAFARTKFFDGDAFQDLYALLCPLIKRGSMSGKQADEVISCLHLLNAYDRRVFSAIATFFKDKVDSLSLHMRKSWLEIFRSCNHKADYDFLQVLQTSVKLSMAIPGCGAALEDKHSLTLVGEPLARRGAGIPRYFTGSANKLFDWEDTSWLSGDEKSSYTKRVKAFKKRGLAFVQAWYNFCKTVGIDYTDPAWHTVPNLQRFLHEMEAMEKELPAGSDQEFFNSCLEQAFQGGIHSSNCGDLAKLANPEAIEFVAKWKLHHDSKRLLASLPDNVLKTVMAEFAPKDTQRDVNGLFRKFAEGKQSYLALREADDKHRK